jgi:hypothetical protein
VLGMTKSSYNAVSSRDEFNWDVLEDNEAFVLWREFRGKQLTPEQFKKFQEDFNNVHRPWCAADCVQMPFLKDLTRKR